MHPSHPKPSEIGALWPVLSGPPVPTFSLAVPPRVIPPQGEQFETLCPVYGVSLLDDIFDKVSDSYYHDYRIVEVEQPENVLEGLRLIFIELPKYRETSPKEARKLRWTWLKFLKEAANAGKRGHPTAEEFRQQVGITEPLRQAIEIAEECGFSPEQLERYDAFWDAVSRERTLMSGKFAEGEAKGRAEGEAMGRAEGEAIGEAKGLLKAAAGMKALGMDSAAIAQATGLTPEQVGIVTGLQNGAL
jgi:predicted transposase/invertase (TIGR01784 family)